MATRNDEMRMMREPMLWPNRILPLVNRKQRHGDNVGVLNGSGPTIYFMNMFDSQYAGMKWEDIPHKTYASFDEIIDEGWVVD